MKRTASILLAFLIAFSLKGISLQECLISLRQNTPLIESVARVELQKGLRDKNLQAGYYPSLSVVGEMGYNSEITKIELGSGLPINPPIPDKDRESIGLEVKQLVWDSGITGLMKEMNNLESKAKALEIGAVINTREMEAVSLYYQVLTLNESLAITQLQKSSLLSRINLVESAYANGIRELSDVQLVKYDMLSLEDRINVLFEAKQAAVDKLSRVCYIELGNEVEFTLPVMTKPENEEFKRNELSRFDVLVELQRTNARLASRKNYPQVLARAQA
ncbi:MAG: TolC family protein, partial [Candidatus Cloacimonetes bacterium]|nr:TolC family protein [Candidatus Cloacimonadota bacterium]